MLLDMALQKQTEDQRLRRIVRLKGGDPFLFGRTRSEIETLRTNNITYTYSPAISSCIAGPHLGGIPLTDTELDCQSFGVWSGTDAFGRSYGLYDEGNEADFTSGVDVLVFLMIGRLDKLEALCDLLSRKWQVDTPCAVIQNAGGVSNDASLGSQTPIQRVWRSTLGNIVRMIRSEDEARVSVSPAVFVVGRVCELDLTCTT
jgi:siroheme synthase